MSTTPLALLRQVGAIITNSHIVYTSGRHGSTYVNKDALFTHPAHTSRLCADLAREFATTPIDVVAGPTMGGIIMAQWVAYHLGEQTGNEVLAVYAEEDLASGQRVFRRGYAELLADKQVLIAEDVLTTGSSVNKVTAAVRSVGGTVVGIAALCNRGHLTSESLDVPHLAALVNVTFESWEAHACPLCAGGVPINTKVGKGAEFLARQ